ncbi:MAG: sialate O-acetylesterase [Chitinophagaceae bacterium]
MKRFSVILFLAFCHQALWAQLKLPAIIGDHMVLQQKTDVKLWGWGSAADSVTITPSWDQKPVYAIIDGSGRWDLKLKTPTAGGPYLINIKTKSQSVQLEDVMVGEVWVCGGQSNMEWSGTQNLQQTLDEAPNATNKNIRLFYVPKHTSDYPQDDVEAKWVVCNPEDMKKFSAIGYFFAKKINQTVGFPMGMINSNWGGTPAETWTPSELVNNDPVLKRAADKKDNAPWWPVRPGNGYNGMIHPLTKFTIAGALWYQGESNVSTHASYQSLFTTMIGGWRKAWNIDFPFYYVQIAPYDYGTNINGALLRESQSKSLSYPKTGMVVVSDLVDNVKDIHPKNKIDVAARLANLALAEQYGQSITGYKSPSYKSMSAEKDKIRISFFNADNGLMSKGGDPNSFTIAGADMIFYPAIAKIEGNTVVVSNKNIKEPVAVRFGFTNTATPNLFSKEGLPVDLFRTDQD